MKLLSTLLVLAAFLSPAPCEEATDSATTITVTKGETKYRIGIQPVKKKEPVIYYTILSKASGFAVAVRMGSSHNGEAIIEWTSKRGHEQQWRMEPIEDGWFSLRARHSDKTLAIREGSKEAGKDAIQWKAGDDGGQGWKLEWDEDGFARLKNQSSGLYLSVRSRGGSHGERLVQLPKEESDDQKWILRIADRVAPDPGK